MKITTDHTKAVWESGDFAGDDRRPTARVTIQRMWASHMQYRLDPTRSKQWTHSGLYTSLLFGANAGHSKPRELFNVRSVRWERGVDMDVGTCTVVLGNVEARNADDPVSDEELDFPGFYTPNRGTQDYFDEWGYLSNSWRGWIQPDRIIRTYEGYGVDNTVAPEHDDHLYPSGTWIIDEVDIDTQGLITLTCRDIGRVLLEQVVFPPAVPWDVYPLWFDTYTDRGKPFHYVTPDSDSHWTRPAYSKSSTQYYASHPEIRDKSTRDAPLRPIVDADGTVYGHHPRDAFDDSTYSFWISEGYKSKHQRDAYAWIEGKMSPTAIEGVKVDLQHGPYRIYISLQKTDGTWLGNKKIPYKANNVDTGANIHYVHDVTVARGDTHSIKLPKRYTNIKKIRLTFGQLPKAGHGVDYVHHAAVNSIYYATDLTLGSAPGTWKYGNYSDYTDIVKWILAWAGWYWPVAATGLCEQLYSDGSTYNLVPENADPAIVGGRVWGDFESTGTNGLTKFDVDTWDKKPFMDCIAVVRDIVGFDFWIDETGGAIWRLPNIWTKGCYIMPTKGGVRSTRTTSLVTIDERKHLINQSVKLSSASVRERVYVGTAGGKYGAVVRGYLPVKTGLRRYAGWTDQHFKSDSECERMADLIALKQSFEYRKNELQITANPALQPDDQVVIKERITGEGNLHRILSISSDFDNDTGQWTYSLTTNWLGNEAFTEKAWDPTYMTTSTRAFLSLMGHL